jgi:hypothetical protein
VSWPKLLHGLPVVLCRQPLRPPGPGVTGRSPPQRRHKPLLGLLAQPPLRLVEAVHVPMMARRAQLELRAQQHCRSPLGSDDTVVRRYSCASSAAGHLLTRVMGGGAVAPIRHSGCCGVLCR